ncbi:hypothetical protein [Lacticaseibacillus hegangensis]|uniref:Uncharacterized protein n=1 Tax=Lacticaseibacillus hegangensis TaxID=2486010 RepID=A0ABW4CVJ5_9LACO|nr:hypothetical protein [Lacticaseibacillus hegangensis]
MNKGLSRALVWLAMLLITAAIWWLAMYTSLLVPSVMMLAAVLALWGSIVVDDMKEARK